ncbi:hypothetical protein B296_00009770, partial [Ensete ventricosum]
PPTSQRVVGTYTEEAATNAENGRLLQCGIARREVRRGRQTGHTTRSSEEEKTPRLESSPNTHRHELIGGRCLRIDLAISSSPK